jgi:hypothetical protein
MAESTMYFAVVGNPIPRMMEATMVRSRVGKSCPPESCKIRSESFSPIPVRVMTPVTIPHIAHAAQTVIEL